MRNRSIAGALFFSTLNLCASPHSLAQQSQQEPLIRTFIAGAEERYQVTATIRVETHGITTEKIGEKTYATPFTHRAEGQVSWRATRKITAINAAGTAGITESLDQFRINCSPDLQAPNASPGLQKSVQDTCANWQALARMNYEEEKFGLIHGLPYAAGNLTGPDSPLLSLWVRRAFRPSVILPKTPLHFDDRAAHKISNPSGVASNPEGDESMEWIEASADAPAATLHVSQNLSWIDPQKKKDASIASDKTSTRQFFYADSLNTVSFLDGGLVKASRSATRETKEVLDPVPGLPDAPTFGSKLTITVTMQRLP
jgi:hypothetical protein